MGSPTHYAYCGKEMLGWIREKLTPQTSAPGGGRFSASSSTIVGNDTSTYNNPCTLGAPSKFSPQNVECKKGEA